MTSEPVLSSTGSLSLSRPVRIFGPCRSCRMQIVRSSCCGGAAQPVNIARMLLMRAVGKVQPGNVHAQLHQFAQPGFGVARRADGADNFGAARGRNGEFRRQITRDEIRLAWFQMSLCKCCESSC